MQKYKIGISIGDINGIGPEVIIKTLSHPKIFDYCYPVVYGSAKVLSYHKNIVGTKAQFQSVQHTGRLSNDKISVINCWQENVNIELGKPTEDSGKSAVVALERAVKDLKAGHIDGLVTAPISKEAVKKVNFPFPGHTEYLTKELDGQDSLMLMVNNGLRIGVATGHLPLRDVPHALDKGVIMRKVRILEKALREDFGINKPTIAVLGLNPHAGENGVLGNEENQFIRPAVIELKKKGIMVLGPFPADGFFGSGQHLKVDGILAMYHDQGLVPFKALSFGEGVNYTAGLSQVRTSPDHGTAFDLAGKNMADPGSFRAALFTAIDAVRYRAEYEEMHANKIGKQRDVQAGKADEAISEDASK